MTMSNTMEPVQENDFSLVQGGPKFQFFLRSRLTTSALGWLKHRIMFFTVITWLPFNRQTVIQTLLATLLPLLPLLLP